MFALTGNTALFPTLIKWHEEGVKPKEAPGGDWDFIVVRVGVAYRYTSEMPYPDPQSLPLAWGTGADYATAAMDCGLSPKDAVEIAAARDIYTGGVITEINIAEALGLVREAAE